MKKIITLVLLFAATVACNRPRIIPDTKLVEITHDIFLANAYRGSTYNPLVSTDSLDIYTPIFDKYGYKPTDFTYTITNLSRRKSIRFTDILEVVTQRLAKEDSVMAARLALLDTMDQRIEERYKQVLFSDSSRRLTTLSNLDKPELILPGKMGRYVIDFIYDLDSASRNNNLRYAHYQMDESDNQTNSYFLGYLPATRRTERIEFTITDPHVKEVQIHLATSLSPKEKSIRLLIDSMKVVYYLPIVEARDSLIREIFTFRSMVPEANYKTQKHVTGIKEIIGALDPDTTRAITRRDSLVRR